MLVANLIFWIAVAIIIGCNLVVAPRIASPEIAMQWGVDGKPTWYAPKQMALWGMVGIMLAIRALIWAAMTYTPALVHGAEAGLIGFALIFTGAYLFIVWKAMRAV